MRAVLFYVIVLALAILLAVSLGRSIVEFAPRINAEALQ